MYDHRYDHSGNQSGYGYEGTVGRYHNTGNRWNGEDHWNDGNRWNGEGRWNDGNRWNGEGRWNEENRWNKEGRWNEENHWNEEDRWNEENRWNDEDRWEDDDENESASDRHVKRRKRKKKRSIAGRIFSTLLKVFFFGLLIIVIVVSIYAFARWNAIVKNAPDISGITFTPGQSATYIYNREGKREQKLALPDANREIVNLSDVPQDLQHAVIAIEDARFYEHHGIDPVGIMRALVKGVTSGSFSQGASTITQQLLKNSVFPGWTTETTFQERLERKIQEQYLAVKLEKVLTKDQILENYLNLINLGAGCYGVQAAAYRYFGKPVQDLTLAEDAVIAGITQNPSAYNPITNPEKNALRRKKVLDAMLDQGYIDQSRYDEAMADPVYDRIQENASTVDTSGSVYTFYQDALIAQVMQDLQDELAYTWQQAYRAVYSGGLRIYSAQNPEVQKICDEEFANPGNFPAGTKVGIDYALSVQAKDKTVSDYGNEHLRAWVRSNRDASFNMMYSDAQLAKADAQAFRESVVKEGDTVLGERVTITPQPQASCVVIDQSNGLVAALVGGRGDKDASLTLNRASYTMRQPGSTFKILTTYAPAIENNTVTLASTIVDEPYTYSFGTPVYNAGRTYSGEVTIRRAIVESINVVAVKLLTQITPQVGFDFAKKMGISTLTDHLETDSGILTDVGQTLALGGISRGVTNLDLTGAYASIANLGHYYQPKFYTEVLDQYGNVILDNTSQKPRTVMKESTAQILTSAMEDVISDENGTAHGQIDLGQMHAAGKTGTTSEWRDSWFVGYTPYYTCGIWAGFDNNEVMPDEDRYHTFSKILWNSIMNRVSGLDVPMRFRLTDGITGMRICSSSHMAASVNCPEEEVYEEIFAAGTQPQYYCKVHGDGSLVSGMSGGIGEKRESTVEEQGQGNGEDILILNQDQSTWQTTPDPNPEQNLGQTAQNPEQNLGQAAQNPEQNLGQGAQNPEQNLGQGVQNPEQNLGQGAQNPEQNLGQATPAPDQQGSSGDTITIWNTDSNVPEEAPAAEDAIVIIS